MFDCLKSIINTFWRIVIFVLYIIVIRSKIEGTRPRYNSARDYDVEGADEVFNKIEEDAAHDIIISLNQTQKRK
jgi:hypothetical protein